MFARVMLGFGLLSAPLHAQSYAAFGSRPQLDVVVPVFSDQDVGALLSTLDRTLAAGASSAGSSERAGDVLWQFARRMQAGRLSRAQEFRVLAHLDRIAAARAGGAALIAGPRRMISHLSVGKPAPEIAGRDLDGKPFRLSDYRNKVVVLVFTAEWCGICRAQAPYERFLLDRYARWPFALLAVDTGSSREAAKRAQAQNPVAHRSWWDESRTDGRGGSIASAWNVVGWPATYVVDGDGIIQFVDLREEDLLKAVRGLVETQADRDEKAQRAR